MIIIRTIHNTEENYWSIILEPFIRNSSCFLINPLVHYNGFHIKNHLKTLSRT